MKYLLLLLCATCCYGAQIRSLSIQTIPSFFYSWGWKLVNFQITDAVAGHYVIEESHNLQQWRICAEVELTGTDTMLLMLQEDLGGSCRFYRIARLESIVSKRDRTED